MKELRAERLIPKGTSTAVSRPYTSGRPDRCTRITRVNKARSKCCQSLILPSRTSTRSHCTWSQTVSLTGSPVIGHETLSGSRPSLINSRNCSNALSGIGVWPAARRSADIKGIWTAFPQKHVWVVPAFETSTETVMPHSQGTWYLVILANSPGGVVYRMRQALRGLRSPLGKQAAFSITESAFSIAMSLPRVMAGVPRQSRAGGSAITAVRFEHRILDVVVSSPQLRAAVGSCTVPGTRHSLEGREANMGVRR